MPGRSGSGVHRSGRGESAYGTAVKESSRTFLLGIREGDEVRVKRFAVERGGVVSREVGTMTVVEARGGPRITAALDENIIEFDANGIARVDARVVLLLTR